MSSSSSLSDATLELTLLTIDPLKKTKPTLPTFTIAWIDPSFKITTKTNTNTLHFPLSFNTLRNPNSFLTIQIFSSRFPFRAAKLVASAALPLSSVPLSGDVRTLQLRKSSGKPYGSLRVSFRVLWALGVSADCNVGPTEFDQRRVLDRGSQCPYNAGPNAPVSDFKLVDVGEENRTVDCVYDEFVGPSAPPMAALMNERREFGCQTDHFGLYGELEENGKCINEENVNKKMMEDKSGNGKGGGPWRSFVVGLVSGAFAVILVGVSSFSEG